MAMTRATDVCVLTFARKRSGRTAMIDTLSEKLFDVSVGRAEPKIPNLPRDHFGREPVTSERRVYPGTRGAMSLHIATLTHATNNPPTQHCPYE